MNPEERQAIGEIAAISIENNLKENEAWQNVLNVFGKPYTEEPPKKEKPTESQFNTLPWTTKKGTKGDYEQTANDSSPEFKALADYLTANKGFLHLYGFKVFFHYNDQNLIDRKR